jgi:hypothetical protein
MHRLPWAGVDRVFAVSNFVRDRLVANGVPASRVRTTSDPSRVRRGFI